MMSNRELINELRSAALVDGAGLMHLLGAAADRIEEQDERLAIIETALEEAERANEPGTDQGH